MAGAAAKILDGLGDKSLSNKQADDFLKWMGDLAGDSFEDNDDSFLEARIHFIYIKTKFILSHGNFDKMSGLRKVMTDAVTNTDSFFLIAKIT